MSISQLRCHQTVHGGSERVKCSVRMAQVSPDSHCLLRCALTSLPPPPLPTAPLLPPPGGAFSRPPPTGPNAGAPPRPEEGLWLTEAAAVLGGDRCTLSQHVEEIAPGPAPTLPSGKVPGCHI